jgi:hypothetical protein
LFDLRAIATNPQLQNDKRFMSVIYADVKNLLFDLSAFAIAFEHGSTTLNLFMKFPSWITRHHHNGDFYDYDWVAQKVEEIRDDAPLFFATFENEFDELYDIAMNPHLDEDTKRRTVDNIVERLYTMANEVLMSS